MKRKYKITVKHWLQKRAKSVDGKYPVYLRIIYNQKSTTLRSTYASNKYTSIDQVSHEILAKEANGIRNFIRSKETSLMTAKEILKAYVNSTKEVEDKGIVMLKSLCNELILAYSKSKRIKRPLSQFNREVQKHLT